ncbi:Uncharacterised protein [BD1-7 clade bacterium]|uniref:Uncharacterized protein n=1 Tax=BD1-7 clade bacterium TaxID=2029982 RepID=A0A5S9P9L7_9GAMM|nr:Uncharacterised protein [BD1-7 clade bacterium]CAA0101171.1 Uncharacterised protein [BD1-7 clade bacterium]
MTKHTSTQAPNSAVFYQQSQYRKNAYDYTKSNRYRLKRYANNEQIKQALLDQRTQPRRAAIEPGSNAHAEAYHFDYEFNFTNSNTPYTNEAHHLIPKGTSKNYLACAGVVKIQIKSVIYCT